MSLWKMAAAASVGLGAYLAVAPGVAGWIAALGQKAAGQPIACEWDSLLRFPGRMDDFLSLKAQYNQQTKVLARDAQWGIVQVQTAGGRPFWVKEKGKIMSGAELVALLHAERDWNRQAIPQAVPRAGDVVLDVGAHIGTFSAFALAQGAAQVIQLEPDPVNVECLRRNFPAEIASGRVVLVPEGAWSREDSLELSVGVANSGTSSLMRPEDGAQKVKVPVRPIDTILAKIGVTRVDYLKMDIEGAEKDALKGAVQLLTQHGPRIHLDANHLADDATAIPALLARLRPGYRTSPGFCECNEDAGGIFTPHTLYFSR